jgi:hypothetical protein
MLTTMEMGGSLVGGASKAKEAMERKPDYEMVIQTLKDQRNAAAKLLVSATEYLRKGPAAVVATRRDGSQPFMELIGFLTVQVESLNGEIDRAITMAQREEV